MNAMRKFFIALIILFTAIPCLNAGENKYLPDTAVTQFAGWIGFVSAGAGYEFYNDSLNLEILYGYVPESIGGIDIHMLTGRSVISPLKYSFGSGYTFYPVSFSIFVNYAIGSQYNVTWPAYYPDRYYRPTALYSGESLGIRIKKYTGDSLISAIEFYADVVTMTEFLYEYFQNDRVTLAEISSLAFGARIHF